MRLLVKILVLGILAGAMLAIGFALGYPIGSHEGFEIGSEWALLQAKLVARDAGVVMPVYLKDGKFHIVLNAAPNNCRKIHAETAEQEPVNEAADVSQPEVTGPPADTPAVPVPVTTEGTNVSAVPTVPPAGT